MKTLHFKLIPRSPVVTPLRGDTLLGHLLWMFAYKHSYEEFEGLLNAIPSNPPAVSDLFPEGKLPHPALPLPPSKDPAKQKELDDYRKEIKGIRFLDGETWKQLRQQFSGERLRDHLLQKAKEQSQRRRKEMQFGTSEPRSSESIPEIHTAISRLTGTAMEGRLYARVRTHYDPNADLHGWLNPGALGNEIWELLQMVGEQGYGADASTGCGQFEVKQVNPDPDADLFELASADGWMALSRHLAPEGVDVDHSYWTMETHYGRLGGSFAVGGNPFKKPILLCGSGSVWRQVPPSRPPGAILGNVAFPPLDGMVKHLGFTIPLPFKWGKTP